MLQKLKQAVKRIPFVGALFLKIKRSFSYKGSLKDSQLYWESRYALGGNSGSGSYNHLATFKAEVINEFLVKNDIVSALEFGCGDGNQLRLIEYKKYVGLDVSKSAIRRCVKLFAKDKSKSFFLYDPLSFLDNNDVFKADLCLSLDVIYHIVEDESFQKYLDDLMNSAKRFVIIYSSDFDSPQLYHVKHRNFSKLIESRYSQWRLVKQVSNRYQYSEADENNTSSAEFFIYEHKTHSIT